MTMGIFQGLEPADVLRYFELICSIPHPSGSEEMLSHKLELLARERGLTTRRDAAGNLRIDRPAAPGLEHRPLVLMQGHLDMVPQAASGIKFDFASTPIRPFVENGFIGAKNTTLGGDDGAGVACALAVLFDDSLKAGPLSALFTVGEETGLFGANGADPEMFAADYLLNLDSECDSEFCVGCAGGARLALEFETKPQPSPAGTPVEIVLSGLRGGHSGCDIDKKRGNALIFLARFLDSERENLAPASFSGGSVSNAIPREARASAVLTSGSLKTLAERAEAFAEKLKSEFDAPASFLIFVSGTEAPAEVWNPEFSKKFFHLAATVPDGVFEPYPEYGIPFCSSNFASAAAEQGKLTVRASQRCPVLEKRKAATARVADHFAPCCAKVKVSEEYPGWMPKPGSVLLEKLQKAYRKINGKDASVVVTHGGLEAGIFVSRRPSLDIVSMGPNESDIHSPHERLEIKSVAKVRRLLDELFRNWE